MPKIAEKDASNRQAADTPGEMLMRWAALVLLLGEACLVLAGITFAVAQGAVH